MIEQSEQKFIVSQATEADQLLEHINNQVDDFLRNSVQCHKQKLLLENSELKAEISRLKKIYEQHEVQYTESAPSQNIETPNEVPNKKVNAKAPKPKTENAKTPKPKTETIEVIDVSRLDFRIGHVLSVEKHPDADSLYVEQINVGEPKPRTVVSGLVKHMSAKEFENKLVVLLCNLKPAKMRGVTSEAMVMCASTPEKVELLIPPTGSEPGDLVEFEGFTRNPDAILNPKKKIFETCAHDLKTDNDCIATYKCVPFVVPGKGKVSAPTLADVQIK